MGANTGHAWGTCLWPVNYTVVEVTVLVVWGTAAARTVVYLLCDDFTVGLMAVIVL